MATSKKGGCHMNDPLLTFCTLFLTILWLFHMRYGQRHLHCLWFPTIIAHPLSSAVPQNVLALFCLKRIYIYIGPSRNYYHFLSICHSFSIFMTVLLSFIIIYHNGWNFQSEEALVTLVNLGIFNCYRNQSPSPPTLAALAHCGPTPIPLLKLSILHWIGLRENLQDL